MAHAETTAEPSAAAALASSREATDVMGAGAAVAAAIDAASLARSAPALLWSASRCSAGHGVTTSVVSAL